MKLRLKITKDKSIRFISHLEYVRTIERAIRRAKLPAAYSEGFNPHLKFSLASALGVGVVSYAEFCEIELAEPMTAEEAAEKMQKALPRGIRILAADVTATNAPALMAEAGGADAVSLINTLTGMKIDINRKTFAVANKTGGVSGPIVKPVAVRMVYQVAQAVNIPIIGMGGISCAEDAIEFLLAGASAVSVETANFHDPAVTLKVIDGIEAYMKKNGFETVKDMVGIVK